MPLSLSFLGSFSVTWEGQTVHFATAAARALFAYLAVEAARPLARAQLAELLWSEQTPEIAFSNLRQTLMRVRRAIPDPPGAQAVLHITKGTLQFKREAATSDVSRFEDLLAECALHSHEDLTRCPDCITRLQEAAALYRGEFLSGLFVDGSQPFEEWVLFKREQLHRQALEALTVLTQHYEATGQFEAMRQGAARQLALEPWQEEAHGQLMRALAYLGDRTAALAQYETCRQLLGAELGIEPRRELRELAERIRTGALERPHKSGLPAPSQPITHDARDARDWNDIPEIGPLFGRAIELEQLQRWLVRERSRLVWVLGIGGVGKTSLAAAAARAVSQPRDGPDRVGQVGRNKDSPFEVVIWRSLLNAPPIEEILRAAVQTLSRGRMAELPVSWDEQLACLVDLLRQRRCLLVLDNFESILQVGDAETYRVGYERYGQLVQCLAQSPHDSCLLITSREQPRETARIVGGAGVHVLRLSGLAPEAGRAMLAANQLGVAADTDETADAEALVQRYSGNPLALKLVAQTVQELFMGSIGDFLSTDAAIFDDVRTVLDQQFERLSPLQHEIMTWLAIMREPVTLATLRTTLVHPPPPSEFLEALRALQRRSLLEQAVTHDVSAHAPETTAAIVEHRSTKFALQNVIMEYVTDRLIAAICNDVESGSTRELNRYALLNVRAKEYVRQSQLRLIVKPIAEQLKVRLGAARIEQQFHCLLSALRQTAPRTPGYAAGSILNLLLQLGFDVAPYDFSQLCVWQADLRGVKSAALNLSACDLSLSAFTLAFSMSAVWLDQADVIHFAGITEGLLCLWQAMDGQLLDAVRTARPACAPITYSGDGRFLAHCDEDFGIVVCTARDGTVTTKLAGHTEKIVRLVFSRDGSMLASCSWDGSVCIWNVHTGSVIHVLREQAQAITCLAFSPDGTTLAGGGEHQMLILWDVHTGQVVHTLQGHRREVECCTFSLDGDMLASGSHDGEIRIWDVRTGQLRRAFMGHTHIVRALVFHPGKNMLASSGANGAVRLWDVQTGRLLHNLFGHAFDVTQLAFSRDGRLLVSGSSDNTVRLWDTATGYALDVLSGHSYVVRAVCFSPDPTQHRLVSADAIGNIHVWDLRSYDVQPLRGDDLVVFSLAFTPDGRHLVSGGADGAVRVWDMANGRRAHVLRGHVGSVKAVAVGAGGQVIASGGLDRTVRLWRMDQSGQAGQADSAYILTGHDDDVIGLAFEPDGYRLVSGSLDHTARVWDVGVWPGMRDVRAELRGVLVAHKVALRGVKFAADGQRIATNTWNYEVCWWDATTFQRIDNRGVEPLRGWGIAFSPDGKLIAIATTTCIEIRDYATQHVHLVLRGHHEQVTVLDFDATSSQLASCDWSGMLYVWDVHTGACLHQQRIPGPYAGMNITGATGISEAQQAALQALGAVSA